MKKELSDKISKNLFKTLIIRLIKIRCRTFHFLSKVFLEVSYNHFSVKNVFMLIIFSEFFEMICVIRLLMRVRNRETAEAATPIWKSHFGMGIFL